MTARLAGAALGAAVLLTLVSGCGGGAGERPERPAMSGWVAPARLPIEQPSTDAPGGETSPTASPQPSEQTTAPPTVEPTEPPTTRTAPVETETPEPQTPSTEPAASADSGTDVPPWLWWLVGAVVIGVGALIWLLVARGRRRRASRERLQEAEAEVAWIARGLLPQLRSTGSRDQAIGGWHVERPRVDAVVDRLTVLASSAGDLATAAHAGRLRDAVRSAQERMEHLGVEDRRDTWVLDVDEAVAQLESALAAPRTGSGRTG